MVTKKRYKVTTPYAKRVARGADAYDQLDPEWWKKVDKDKFDMSSNYRCL